MDQDLEGNRYESYFAVLSSPYGSVNTAVATVSVPAPSDFFAKSAAAVQPTEVGVQFNRPLDPSTATNPNNYAVNGSVPVQVTLSDPTRCNLDLAVLLVAGNFTVEITQQVKAADASPYAGGTVNGTYWASSTAIGSSGATTFHSGAPGQGEITTGGPETNLMVQVKNFTLPQMTGADGSFRFRLIPPGLNTLIVGKIAQVIDGTTGQTNQVHLDLRLHSVPITLFNILGMNLNVDIPVPQVVPPPPCGCKPWCSIISATINGVNTVVAGGGKLGQCPEAPQISITGPGIHQPNAPEGNHEFPNAASGDWTITVTVCGQTQQAHITVH